MHVFLADIDEAQLASAVDEVKALQGRGDVSSMTLDVADFDAVMAMKEKVLELHGEVAVLMNNVRGVERGESARRAVAAETRENSGRPRHSTMRPSSPSPSRPRSSTKRGITRSTSTSRAC